MVLKAPLKTDFLQLTYPDENCDPFYDQFVAFITESEAVMYMSKVLSNMWITAGGTRTWNSVGGIFTWTSDFIVPVPYWGYKITVPFGPDAATRTAGLADGNLLIVSVPMSFQSNAVSNFQVVSKLDPNRNDQFVCGMRVGNALYLKGIGELT